jgi:trans-aconitate methyltransferase
MDDDTADSFQRKIISELKKRYSVREDGKVLFDFKRMFMIARR